MKQNKNTHAVRTEHENEQNNTGVWLNTFLYGWCRYKRRRSRRRRRGLCSDVRAIVVEAADTVAAAVGTGKRACM